ncbi:MAG: TatD family hydrolase [Spirochaetaceae bacterium]|nr:TatD family hydrolase [Spirochaetaceae bacterium]
MTLDDFEPEAGCAGLFDTHAHLSYLDGRGINAEKLVPALFKAGFTGIIDVGTTAGDLAERMRAFSRFEHVRFSAGLWPHKEFLSCPERQLALLEQDIDTVPAGSVVAVGECGFDRRENPEPSGAERELLERQLDLARRRGLPVIIHSREAPAETIETLAAYPDVGGIIHCFSYGSSEARAFLDMGYYISFAGNISFKNAGALRETLKSVPLDRLLLETDSPYLAPEPYRGKPSHPGMIMQSYRRTAELLKIDIEELKERLRRNAAQVFNLRDVPA